MAHEFDRGGYEVEIRSTYFKKGTADELLNILLQWVDQGSSNHQHQGQAEELIIARL